MRVGINPRMASLIDSPGKAEHNHLSHLKRMYPRQDEDPCSKGRRLSHGVLSGNVEPL
jgi:hypothetical protein